MLNINNYTYDKYLDGECGVLDAHCHIGLMPEPGLYASAIGNFEVITCGTLPSQFERDIKYASDKVHVGLGFHPRDIKLENYQQEAEIFQKVFKKQDPQIIGEIGLDFSDKYAETKDLQIETFRTICKEIAKTENKILSIHAIKSADVVLDILEEEGLFGDEAECTSSPQNKKAQASKNGSQNTNSQDGISAAQNKKAQASENTSQNAIIFHWFSDSGEALNRARNAGVLFSVGPKMLATRRGHDYIRQIPENQLLIETDLPWDNEPLTPTEHFNILNDFLIDLRDTRGY